MLAAAVEQTGGVATSALTAGQVGLVDASTYLTVAAGTVPAEFLIVQGNYNQVDTIGGNKLHGGYAESIKSKMIKTRYINKMWKANACAEATCPTLAITVPDDCFSCEEHPQLRLDVKGSDVLRALNRNGYIVLDAGGCCTGVNFTGTEVAEAWAEQLNADETLNKFVTAAVNGGVITFTLCHTATDFADSSFDTRDHYNVEPLTLIASAIDDEGDACTDSCLRVGDATIGVDANGVSNATISTTVVEFTGETLLRDLILDGRYRQDGGHNQGNRDSSRRREIEGGSKLIDAVDRDGIYAVYYIQHSVPRLNNPTGVFDNDQYVVATAALCGSPAAEALDMLHRDIQQVIDPAARG